MPDSIVRQPVRAVECGDCRLVAEGGIAYLRGLSGLLEDFSRFLCRFAEGQRAYCFEVDDELLDSIDIFNTSLA